MSPHNLKRLCSLSLWLILSVIGTLGLVSGSLRDLEARTWDWRARCIADPKRRDSRIQIISIDQSALDYFAKHEKIYWPWPRSLYVPVIEFLRRAGAKGVAFDLIFTDDVGRVEEDIQLAAALAGEMPVVQAFVPRVIDVERDEQSGIEQKLRQFTHYDASRFLSSDHSRHYTSAKLPAPELLNGAATLGSVVAEADNDTIFRRAIPGGWLGSVPFLSLPFALYARTIQSESLSLKLASQVDGDGEFLIRFHGSAGSYETHPIHAIINSWLQITEGKTPGVDLQRFKDAYVFVGATAPGLLDLRSVPLGGVFSGVEVNATILDNLIHEDFLRSVPVSSVAMALCIALGLVVLGAVSTYRRWVMISAIAPIVWVAICFLGAAFGWWIPMVVPVITVVTALSLGFLIQYQIEGKQHRFVRGAFKHFVSADVVERIVQDPRRLALGGERREMTMFFADIEGFTSLSEKMEPGELVRFINRLLSEVTDIIVRYEGTIDKYEGDAVIAFWNAPLPNADHRARAVEAALACQKRLHDLADLFHADFGIKPRLRIGLNTGVVTVGNFGSTTRFNYTVIGDAVNLASRLEGTNKVFGTQILVSQSTHEGLSNRFTWRRVGQVAVKGKSQPTQLFEPLDPRLQERMIAALSEYEDGLSAFERGDLVAAIECFASLDFDPVSRSYLSRIERDGAKSVGTTSQPLWILTEK